METATLPKAPAPPKIDVFKGNPVITLNPEEKWPFTFGLTKAKLILANLDAIRTFVDANEKKDA
jgi:hypothetical protein